MGKLSQSDMERFWQKVDFNGPTAPHMQTPCWVWTAATTRPDDHLRGYGLFGVKHRSRTPARAHRVAWEMAEGADAGPWHVLHACDTPACVRRDHLFLGTNADNTADRVAKGRTRTWATERERLGQEHPRAKLTDAVVIEARRAWRAGEKSSVTLAAEHQVAQATMHAALTGKTWRHLPEQ